MSLISYVFLMRKYIFFDQKGSVEIPAFTKLLDEKYDHPIICISENGLENFDYHLDDDDRIFVIKVKKILPYYKN